MAVLYYESQLAHHGIKGQKWGVRRFQRLDGRLTPAGRRRRNNELDSEVQKNKKKWEYDSASDTLDEISSYLLPDMVKAIRKNGKRLPDDVYDTINTSLRDVVNSVDRTNSLFAKYNNSGSKKDLSTISKEERTAIQKAKSVINLFDRYGISNKNGKKWEDYYLEDYVK